MGVRVTRFHQSQNFLLHRYRKPINKTVNCTTSSPEATEFTTDFGVTFGLMMEEDLVLKNARSLKNYIVAGEWRSEIPFLSGKLRS